MFNKITFRCTVNLDILKEARRKVTKLCCQPKTNYFPREIRKYQSVPKQLSNITKRLLNKKKESPLSAGEPKEIAEKFITFFTNKFKKITETFTPSKENQARIITTIDNELASFTLVIAEILKREILKGNSKACHLDPIPTWLVKECLDVLIPTVTNIVNTSLDSSLMPDIFKTATVTPLLKKLGLSVEEYKNFRPVSNLPYLSKLMEKVVVKQLNNYMEVNGLTELNQSTYGKHQSTETALVSINNDTLCAIKNI